MALPLGEGGMSGLSVAVAGKAGSFAVEAAFEAGPGITALFGPSGSGKTTMLRMIAGVNRPDTGRIAIGGQTVFDAATGIDMPPSRRGIGYVFQDGRLFPHLSVRRNLTYARWAGRRAASRSFDEVMALLGIGGLLDRAPATLSGGERQRVAIGRALLADPRLLLMDEPLSSLDRARRQDVLPYLEAIRADTTIPIVYVSHEIDEIARLADTIVTMESGRSVLSGPAAEVFGGIDADAGLGGFDAGSLIEGTVSRIDAEYGLAEVAFGGGAVEIAAVGLSRGQPVRLRVLARDVAVARSRPEAISIRNCLSCVIEGIRDGASEHVDIALRAGSQRFSARITRKSRAELDLRTGEPVFALIKAVSVDRRGVSAATASARGAR